MWKQLQLNYDKTDAMVAAHISVCNSQLRTNTWRLRVSNSQMFSHRCQKGVFCALLEKISIFVNFLPCVVVVLCVFLLVYCSVVSAFVPHLEYLFLFVLGSAIVMFLVFVVGDRSALNVEQCAVIQSDCVVCYLFSHGDDSASVSLASRVTTDFELKRKV